jgi:5-hydroxyisourate hydrolase
VGSDPWEGALPHLSTHVLDVSRGVPAHGLVVELHVVQEGQRRPVATLTTNRDGRTDVPLLSAARLEPGIYELTFHAGEYFRRAGIGLTDPPFFGDVVVRVGIADPTGDYHVPLLLSPFAYSTYRGS